MLLDRGDVTDPTFPDRVVGATIEYVHRGTNNTNNKSL
jgi:hypothetical protein